MIKIPNTVQIIDSLYNKLVQNWTLTPIANMNDRYNPDTETAFIEPYILFTNTEYGELGNGTGVRFGILAIKIFVQKNTGNRQGHIYAKELEDIFRREDIDYIYFDEPTSSDGYPSSHQNYFQVNMTINFHSVTENVV